MTTQELGSLTPTWEPWMELLGCWLSPSCYTHLGSELENGTFLSVCLSLSLCHSAFRTNTSFQKDQLHDDECTTL